jgi:hypothetical protein
MEYVRRIQDYIDEHVNEVMTEESYTKHFAALKKLCREEEDSTLAIFENGGVLNDVQGTIQRKVFAEGTSEAGIYLKGVFVYGKRTFIANPACDSLVETRGFYNFGSLPQGFKVTKLLSGGYKTEIGEFSLGNLVEGTIFTPEYKMKGTFKWETGFDGRASDMYISEGKVWTSDWMIAGKFQQGILVVGEITHNDVTIDGTFECKALLPQIECKSAINIPNFGAASRFIGPLITGNMRFNHEITMDGYTDDHFSFIHGFLQTSRVQFDGWFCDGFFSEGKIIEPDCTEYEGKFIRPSLDNCDFKKPYEIFSGKITYLHKGITIVHKGTFKWNKLHGDDCEVYYEGTLLMKGRFENGKHLKAIVGKINRTL